MHIPTLIAAMIPLNRIAHAYNHNLLADEARKFHDNNNERPNTTDPEDIELYSGRGGRRLLTLGDVLRAHALLCQPGEMHNPNDFESALQPLVNIADAYDANELDDEARKIWGRNGEHVNTTDPKDIELYCSSGGACLLTLADALRAREAVQPA